MRYSRDIQRCWSIYNNDTAWLAEVLTAGPPISDMLFSQSLARPITPGDIVILRKCWVACDLRYGFPTPRDLKPVAIEIFALAAYTQSDELRPSMTILSRAWPNVRDEIDDFLHRRFRASDATPCGAGARPTTVGTFITNLTVPAGCAAVLRDLINILSDTCFLHNVLDNGLSIVTHPGTRAALSFPRTRMFTLNSDGHEISYAGAMLLIGYIHDTVRKVQLDATRYINVLYDLDSIMCADARRTVETACNLILSDHVRGNIDHILANLELEHRRQNADHHMAFAMGAHASIGRASPVSWLDDETMRSIRDMVAGPTPDKTVLFSA